MDTGGDTTVGSGGGFGFRRERDGDQTHAGERHADAIAGVVASCARRSGSSARRLVDRATDAEVSATSAVLLGSVAERVVRTSSVPVLAVAP